MRVTCIVSAACTSGAKPCQIEYVATQDTLDDDSSMMTSLMIDTADNDSNDDSLIKYCRLQVWESTPGYGSDPFLDSLWTAIDEVRSQPVDSAVASVSGCKHP
jgi:hypothetical protein